MKPTVGGGIGKMMVKSLLTLCKRKNTRKLVLDSLGDFKTRNFYFKTVGMMDVKGLVQTADQDPESKKAIQAGSADVGTLLR